MPDIYHIVKRSDWDAAVIAGVYAPGSLDHEGFIHCSKQWQVLDVVNSQYQGQKGLVVLRIDTKNVTPEIRNEDCYDIGQSFPHIYGPLNIEAVKDVYDVKTDDDGAFSLPSELS